MCGNTTCPLYGAGLQLVKWALNTTACLKYIICSSVALCSSSLPIPEKHGYHNTNLFEADTNFSYKVVVLNRALSGACANRPNSYPKQIWCNTLRLWNRSIPLLLYISQDHKNISLTPFNLIIVPNVPLNSIYKKYAQGILKFQISCFI